MKWEKEVVFPRNFCGSRKWLRFAWGAADPKGGRPPLCNRSVSQLPQNKP